MQMKNDIQFARFSPISDPLVQQLISFRHLPEGWLYGRGVPAKEISFRNALNIFKRLKSAGAAVLEVFPEESGGVLVSGYKGDQTADILCRSDGFFEVDFEKEDEDEAEILNARIGTVIEFIEKLKWRQMSFYDFSIQNTTVLKKEDSRAWRLVSPQTEPQLSPPSVPESRADQNAHIYANSIPLESPVNHLYFSDYTSPIYLRTVQ